MFKITVQLNFSAAHHLREYNGDCENIHGHNWRVSVSASFPGLAENGLAMDFRDLKSELKHVINQLDHKDLNEIEYFIKTNPTSENIAYYIFSELKARGVPVSEVSVAETDNCTAIYSEE